MILRRKILTNRNLKSIRIFEIEDRNQYAKKNASQSSKPIMRYQLLEWPNFEWRHLIFCLQNVINVDRAYVSRYTISENTIQNATQNIRSIYKYNPCAPMTPMRTRTKVCLKTILRCHESLDARFGTLKKIHFIMYPS